MTTKGKLDMNVRVLRKRMVQLYYDGGYFLESKLQKREIKVFSVQMMDGRYFLCIVRILDGIWKRFVKK